MDIRHTTIDGVITYEIRPALGDHADDYDLEAIAAEAYTRVIDLNSAGQEIDNTARYEQILEGEDFWAVVAKHEIETSSNGELWTAAQAAAHLGITRDAARRQLSRWGIRRAGTGESEAGRLTALYPAAEIRARHATRPGPGARTDLT